VLVLLCLLIMRFSYSKSIFCPPGLSGNHLPVHRESFQASPEMSEAPSELSQLDDSALTHPSFTSSSALCLDTKPDAAPSSSDRSSEAQNPHLAAGWVHYTTAEGVPYYHNSVTGASTWTVPVELKS